MPTPPRAPRLWLTDLPVLVVAAIWGSSYLSVKTIATGDTVVPLLVLRFLVALLPMAALVAGRLRRLTLREIRGGVVLGLILATIFLVETYGVVHTSATNAGLIISLTMVFTPLVESLLARTRPSAAFVAAAVLSVVGVALLTQGAGFERPGLGDLLVLLVAVIRAIHVVVMHRMKSVRRTESGALTFVQLATCLGVFVLVSPFSGPAPWRLAATFDGGQWADLLYLGLMCTVFAFFVQMWAVRRTSPSRVSLLLGTEPLWAALIGVEIGGDKLGALGMVGAGLVLVGTSWGRVAAGRSVPAEPVIMPVPETVNANV
jgi:drug/metabolite transporter (DMT)-like permease